METKPKTTVSTLEERDRTFKRIAWRILPFATLVYIFVWLDRVNVGFAKLTMLDDLGWTKDDLAQFLSRWEAAKKEAASSKKAKGELDEALRSLGLRPQNDKLRRGDVKSDNVRGLNDVGPQSAPPSKYLDQFRAFKKGAARAK